MAKFKRFEEGRSSKKLERRREDFDQFESVARRDAKKEKQFYNEDAAVRLARKNYFDESEDI
jgi:hypothetical protein|tara:strand:- start:1532 stop:1717 length:186 start_codon:yes stop_codon:yes gene_type:complete